MNELKALILPLLAGSCFLIGVGISRFAKNKDKLSYFANALAFLVMIGMLAFDLFPECISLFQSFSVLPRFGIILGIALLGILLLKGIDLFIPTHHHAHHEGETNVVEHKNHLVHIGIITSFALLFHNIIEGMAIYMAGLSDLKLGLFMCAGVALHNIPLGMEIAATMQLGEEKNRKRIFFIVLLALSSLFGGLLIWLLPLQMSDILLGVIISFTLGMMIYIALFELLGEVVVNWRKKETKLGIICGMIIIGLSLLV